MTTQDAGRLAFDEAVANMTLPASPFFREYVFYMHLISQCKVIFNENLPAAAGVTFKHDHYVLYLNPKDVIAVDINGEEVLGFTQQMPLKHRIGILKHEMLHIALGHILRVEDRDFKLFNYASDCALNQEITRDHLPNYAIYPDNFPSKVKVPLKQTAEIYYDLLEEEKGKSKNSSEEGNEIGTGTPLDDHEVWKEVEGDTTLQKELTKNMVEKAADSTQKQRGLLPASYSAMIENLTVNREVNWKQVLRSIVGNKKANQRKTIMRKDRRLPFANWLKGKQKDRIFELGVISDVSGSVSDKALLDLWGEIIHICELFDTPVKIVQVDSEAYAPTTLDKKTRLIERKARGGTYLTPGIESFKQAGCKIDAFVVTTDGYLSTDDIDNFGKLKKPIIWLIEEQGEISPHMMTGQMRAIKLTGAKK